MNYPQNTLSALMSGRMQPESGNTLSRLVAPFGGQSFNAFMRDAGERDDEWADRMRKESQMQDQQLQMQVQKMMDDMDPQKRAKQAMDLANQARQLQQPEY